MIFGGHFSIVFLMLAVKRWLINSPLFKANHHLRDVLIQNPGLSIVAAL
jgi:hypothetical protein